MLYVKYDENNTIIDLQFSQMEGYTESSLFDEEIANFLKNSQNEALVKDVLKRLDLDLVRVIEDMVDIMIEKNILLFTDLPEPVQNKLLFKKSIRQSLSPHVSLIEEEEILDL